MLFCSYWRQEKAGSMISVLLTRNPAFPGSSPALAPSWIRSRLSLLTVPYFFVRSFRYTGSYRHGYLDFQMYRGGRRRGLPRHPSSFDTHPRWQPVTLSSRSQRSYGKIEDCEQSTSRSSGVQILGHNCK